MENHQMKPHNALFAALAATSILALAAQPLAPLPTGWIVAGKSPELYSAGVDRTQTMTGKGSKYMRSISKTNGSWATMMQMFSAEQYRGQRVRLQARVKTKDVSLWAGLWMRVDGPGGIKAFYNSQNQPIKGSTDWQLRTVVLDVAADASAIALGVIDAGSGEVWMDDVKLDVVDKTVPVDAFPGAELAKVPNL
jgi:hypothetical protein